MQFRKHLEGVKDNVSAGIINMGGAMLDDPFKEGEAMKINGSALVLSAETKEDAMKIVESDIYYKSGVWDPNKVIEHAASTLDSNNIANSYFRSKFIRSRLQFGIAYSLPIQHSL